MSAFQSHSKASYKHQVPVKETIALIAGYQAREWASLVVQIVKNPPAMPETWVRSQDWEDPLEEGMATHSNILAWRIPMDRGAWCAAVHGVAKICTQLNDYALHSTAIEGVGLHSLRLIFELLLLLLSRFSHVQLYATP